ncbi:MAG: hypothetical protein ACRD29_12575 [Acidimicrobiales bacterium]
MQNVVRDELLTPLLELRAFGTPIGQHRLDEINRGREVSPSRADDKRRRRLPTGALRRSIGHTPEPEQASQIDEKRPVTPGNGHLEDEPQLRRTIDKAPRRLRKERAFPDCESAEEGGVR